MLQTYWPYIYMYKPTENYWIDEPGLYPQSTPVLADNIVVKHKWSSFIRMLETFFAAASSSPAACSNSFPTVAAWDCRI